MMQHAKLLILITSFLMPSYSIADISEKTANGKSMAIAEKKQVAGTQNEKSGSNKVKKSKESPAPQFPPPSQKTLNMIRAIDSGNYQLAELLFNQGGDVNCPNCNPAGAPPILALNQYIVDSEQSGMRLEWLLNHNANPNQTDRFGVTVMMRTINLVTQPGFSAINDFLLLLDRGASAKAVDSDGNGLLHYLSRQYVWTNGLFFMEDNYRDKKKQGYAVFNKLIQHGADINAINKNAETPLLLVADSCNPELIKAYLSHGADAIIKNAAGKTAYDIALETASGRSNQNCNNAAYLLSPTAANDLGTTPALEQSPQKSASVSSIEWTGIFQATRPKPGTAQVTATASLSGEVIFTSSSGLSGKGQIAENAGHVTGSVTAVSPKDSTGQPVFGAQEIVFDFSGTSKNGVMRGSYKSAIESGNFVLCTKDARQFPENKCDAITANPLSDLINGLKSLKF